MTDLGSQNTPSIDATPSPRHRLLQQVRIPAELPIAECAEAICQAIQQAPVVILAGETGSGKTTQLPKLCLQAGRGQQGLIGHTQPRRLAARSVAARIAEELQEPFGQGVGYQVRFQAQISSDTVIKVMTDGILLAAIGQDPDLKAYDTLIIDEAHERSLNIDFLLGYLKRLLLRRPELRIIITSATIDVERFSAHFNQAPIIRVGGRSYPVAIHYLPRDPSEQGLPELADQVLAALEQLWQWEREGSTDKRGDVLVFLPGERDIRETAKRLREAAWPATQVLPLYARLTPKEQDRIFRPSGQSRRIVLATNVAETSLTVPGIHYVIDSGLARISRYSARSQIQHLHIEPISQASANQRAGRCGRIAPGLCIRLFSESDFKLRPEFTDPEIMRTHLASVILQMMSLRLGAIEHFPFIDPPQSNQIRDGFRLLNELSALNDRGRLSSLGRRLAQLPIDPRLARMLLAGHDQGALAEVLIVVSFLAIQDPREMPSESRANAQQKHAQDHDPAGDFAVILNLWQRFEAQRQALSSNQFKHYCRREFLNVMRLREWRELHHQLRLACQKLNLNINVAPAGIAEVHQAILSGLLSQVGQWKERKTYQMARGKQAVLFPGSALYRKPPPWLMSFELVETQQLYARMVAPVDPAWCETAGAHLVKRSYSEPHFAKKRAQVMAWEKVTLFGLVIIGRRRVNYSQIDPVVAHDLFIREGLVAGQYESRGAFMAHNQGLLAEVASVEDRVRRRDLRIDDDTLADFYHARIPEQVCNGKGFEAWRRKAEHNDPKCLFFDPDFVWQQSAPNWQEAFPDQIKQGAVQIPLNYRFEPQAQDDGVTAVIPAVALGELSQASLDWLVPGLLEEKAIALVKALPKAIRRQLVPVPDTVQQALSQMGTHSDQPLTAQLAHQFKRLKGVVVPPDAWDFSKLPDHLQVNIRVVDDQGQPIAEGRDLEVLRSQVRTPVQAIAAATLTQPDVPLRHWPIEDLPRTQSIQQSGMAVTVYPTLRDQGDHVVLHYELDADYSHHHNIQGLARLGTLALSRQLDEIVGPLLQKSAIPLLYAPLGNVQALRDDFHLSLMARVLLPDLSDLPRTQEAFDQALHQARGHLFEAAQEQVHVWTDWLQRRHDIAKQLQGKMSLERAVIASDVKTQLSRLIERGRLAQIPRRWQPEITRYLQGMQIRLNRSGIQVHKEQALITELDSFWQRYANKAEQVAQSGRYLSALEDFRWLIEEYRISLFAQTLGTVERVSSQRLEKHWQALQSL